MKKTLNSIDESLKKMYELGREHMRKELQATIIKEIQEIKEALAEIRHVIDNKK